MGRLKKTFSDKHYACLDLNEMNVQTIFNRCLATKDAPEESVSESILFSRTLGYNPSDEVLLCFDKQKLLENKLNIMYLYGQLKAVHQKLNRLSIESAFYSYSGKAWTANKAYLLELLYLGCTDEVNLIPPFSAKDNSAPIGRVNPTLSPKDPNFPAWWEAHKGEWEN